MKHKIIFFAILMMAMAFSNNLKAYDFTATVPSGQTLYFKNSAGGKALVTYPGNDASYPYGNYGNYPKPTGDLVIPATIVRNGVTWDIVGIDTRAFYQCSELTSVKIECPGNIGSHAFYYCDGLSSIVIGDNISSIGTYCFYHCSSLTTAIIGNGCSSIGDAGFNSCGALNTVVLGNTLSSIGTLCFGNCNSLSNITCYAMTPPSTSSSFSGVSSYCSIIVPVGTSTTYSIAQGWNQFVNITEMTSQITTTVNSSDEAMGTVSVFQIANIVTLSATANENYHFVQWNDGNTDNPRMLTLTTNASFIAIFDPNQYTITGSALSGGTVAGGGTVDYLDSVTLTATPNEGYSFTKWRTRTGSTYDDYSTDNPLTVEVTENLTYYAMFEQIACNVAALPSDSTMGYTTGSGTVYYGNNVQMQAYANTGYRFVGWSDGVIASSRSVYVTSDITLTAVFEPIPQYVLSLGVNNSSMGSVNGGGTFYEGTTATFSATANTGYRFTGWSDGIASATRSITMTADTTISANFEYIDYAVRAQSGNTLRGTVEGSDTVHYGETVTLTATAYEHFVFQYWQTAGGEIYGQNPLTLTVTSNGIYTAVFAAEQHTVQVLTDGGGTVRIGNSSNSGNYDYFSQLTLTATANGNNAFLRWEDGNSFNPRTVTITSDTVFKALFLNGTTYLHDTIIDTVYFNHYTHDTTYINNYVHDTVRITTYVFDTTIVNIHQFDTTIITNQYYDTIFVHIHDTVYIIEGGIDGMDELNAKVYSSQGQIVVEGAENNRVILYDVSGRVLAIKQDNYMPLRFDAPTSGTYMIKIGNYATRRVVVVR